MPDYTSTPQTFLADSALPLVSAPGSADWRAYADLQAQIESLLVTLFAETDGVLGLSDYALSLADSAFDEAQASLRGMLSDLQAFQAQADRVASAGVPLTGLDYTALVTESFRDPSVRDAVSLFGYEEIGLQEPGAALSRQMAQLNGLRWDIPIMGGSNQCVDPAPVTTTMAGPSGHTYEITLRFRGAIELKDYAGGTNDGGYWQVGGSPTTGPENVYRLDVSSPAQTYYLNRRPADLNVATAYLVDYVKMVSVDAGATVTLTAQTVDGLEIPTGGLSFPGVSPGINGGQFLQMNVVDVADSDPSAARGIGCLPQPPLEVDPVRQVLRLRKEGEITAFSGLPGAASLGGRVEVDRSYGTPSPPPEAPWAFSAASRSPLGPDQATAWLPETYQGGAAARLHVTLRNPSAVSEVRLRGAVLPGGQDTQLLETVAAVSSRPDPQNLTGVPARALNGGWSGRTLNGWSLTPGSSSRWTVAPDRPNGSMDASLVISGQAFTAVAVRGGSQYVLRYRAFCPYGNPADAVAKSPTPVPPSATFVTVLSYASESPTVGSDPPLSIEVFRDDYPRQGDSFAGAGSFVHLVRAPAGAKSLALVVGTDPALAQSPSQSGAEVAYSDLWLCDEAIVRVWQTDLPSPAASSSAGPSVPGGPGAVRDEVAVDSLTVPLGNPSGAFIVSDVWVTVGQDSPSLAPASALVDAPRPGAPGLPPYALSLPVDLPSSRASHDPLLIHQARYVGSGPTATDVGPYRVSGIVPAAAPRRLRTALGLWSSLLSRDGRLDPAPSAGPWKGDPDEPAGLPDLRSAFPRLWSALVTLSKARGFPAARPLSLLLGAPPVPGDDSALYVYTAGLSSLSLIREEYARSGIYVTQPLLEVGSLAGEIREVGVVTDPPLATFGERVRLWVVPDSEVLAGTSQDSPGALLARAVPLDTQSPRASFHCTAESLTGVAPATSDVVDAWNAATRAGISQPAFAVPPSLAVDRITGGLDPDQSALRLSHLPYVNREAVYRINAAMSSGTAFSPRHYDPNAVRPLADLVLPGASGNLYAVTGYRPVTLTLTLPNGAKVLPDALGAPRPGEVVFSGREVLSESTDVTSQVLPAQPSVYTYQTGDNPALSSRTRVAPSRAYLTSHSPIAAGANGASIRLWWHQSSQFDPASGGLLINHDVEIPASDYEVDTQTGQVRVITAPPGSWEAYDQVVAEYFWQVGEVAPREYFPTPDLNSLYTPFVPYLVSSPEQPAAPLPLYAPTRPLFQGYKTTGTLVSDPAFLSQDSFWKRLGRDTDWNGAGRGSSFAPHVAHPWHYWFADSTGEGVQQDVPYPGPGQGAISVWFSYNPDNHSGNYQVKQLSVKVEVYEGAYSAGSVLESYSFLTHPVQRGTTGLPCLAGSQTDASNLTDAPPAWFPDTANWPAFKAGLTLGTNQTVYQWPSSRMVSGNGGYVVSTADGTAPGDVPDNQTTFGVVAGESHLYPYGVAIEFASDKVGSTNAARKVRVTTTLYDGSNDGQGIMGFRTDLWWVAPYYQQGCVDPYSYDPITQQCKYTPPAASGSADGSTAGALQLVPSTFADLIRGPISQAYPVTRNVTNYVDATSRELRPADLDPLSPGYYPVFEYRVDPGGVPRLADDFSALGAYAGTDLEFTYEYLDISPRLIVEVLPEGQSATDLPSLSSPSLRPATETPELSSVTFPLNART